MPCDEHGNFLHNLGATTTQASTTSTSSTCASLAPASASLIDTATSSCRPENVDLELQNEWSSYGSRANFELADFLYRKVQMPQRRIDELMDIWAATLLEAGVDRSPPFRDFKDLYSSIDAAMPGSLAIPWKSFAARYDGDLPVNGEAPDWMENDYEVWYMDAAEVVAHMLDNPDFERDFDKVPYREFDQDHKRRWCDFFSGDFAWNQAVGQFVDTSMLHSCFAHFFL